jgi:GNAT superfamily N-acetyltransferase
VHRLLAEQCQHSRANVAAAGSPPAPVAWLERSAEAAPAWAAPASLEAAVAVSVGSVVDPGLARVVVVVVPHVCLLTIRALEVRSRYIGNISQVFIYSERAIEFDGAVTDSAGGRTVLRPAIPADVEACLAVQRRSAVVGYAHIFPQDEYPFPDDLVRVEWVARLSSDAEALVAVDGDEIVGTATAQGPFLEALFVVPEQWGTGVAGRLHDAVLALIAAAGEPRARLNVMVDNSRARRFYERRGWRQDGRTEVTPFPPYPQTLGYSLDICASTHM